MKLATVILTVGIDRLHLVTVLVNGGIQLGMPGEALC
jgi:hypothetical protein